MMKISNCYSRFAKRAAIFSACVLWASAQAAPNPGSAASSSPQIELPYAPFGERKGTLQEHVNARNPWNAFADRGALLWSTRLQRVADGDCSKWAKALVADRLGEPFLKSPGPAERWTGWQPWKEKDRDSVLECDEFPCAVKLNRAETQTMAKLTPEKRWEKFHELVAARAIQYLASGARTEYEFSGDPVDPWGYFEKASLTLPGVSRQTTPMLLARHTDFLSGNVHVLRQIVDWRATLSADGKQAAAWVRDAYTDHYFDGWGEWTAVICENMAVGKGVLVAQTMLVELDLMKKDDLLSKVSRGSMRAGVEKQGKIFLESAFKRLEKAQQ